MRKQPSPLEWHFADQADLNDKLWETGLLPANSAERAIAPTEAMYGYWSSNRWWRDGLLLTLLIAILLWAWPWSHPTQTLPITQPVNATAPAETVLETTFFRFHFRPQDTSSVKLVALYIDQTYLALRRDFELEPPVSNDKLTIEIGAATMRGSTGTYPDLAVTELFAPTSVLSTVGTEVAKLTVMNRLSEWLVGRVLEEAIQQTRSKPLWWPEIRGLQHYFVLRQQGSNVWRYIATRAESEQIVAGLSRQTILSGHTELSEGGHGGQNQRHIIITTTLADYTEIGEQAYTHRDPLRYIGVTTLVDYVVTTYGQQRLPALLQGFRRYDSWAELSPAVFGIPASQLEAEWRAYLLRHTMQAMPPCKSQTVC